MSIVTGEGKIKRPTHEDVHGITMSTTKQKQPVTFKHTGTDAPHVLRGTNTRWEYQSITGAETLSALGAKGWEAYAVVAMPGALRIFLKREVQ